MFKKLRNRFLILNLVIITIMMIISFTSIYLITYKNVRGDINQEISKLSEFDRKPNENQDQVQNKGANGGIKQQKIGDDKWKGQSPIGRSVSFNIKIDDNNEIISYFSLFEMDEAFYESAKESALKKTSSKGRFKLDDVSKGRFKLDDTYWEFVKKPSMDGTGYEITFLDVTSRYTDLTNLIYTFIAVALIMLIAIFFISRFFANKSIKPIKETFERQKQFIADASHELKTPLAVINTNADVLLSNSQDTIINQKRWVDYIKSEVERMTKLTNDLLYLAQVDHLDVKLISADFNFSEVIENVILTMEASIFENNMFLDYNIEPNVIVHGNSEQIKQVIMILLDNALKYTNPKGKIDFSLRRHNNKAIMKILNTGKGIPEENLDKIFDRFYRVDKSRAKNSGGHGLGLSIAKAIVNQYGGKISVDSIVDESTRFIIEMPIVEYK